MDDIEIERQQQCNLTGIPTGKNSLKEREWTGIEREL